MNRRDFLRRAGLIAAGAIAADQLDLLDRLGWTRTLFAGWRASESVTLTSAEWDALLRDVYSAPKIEAARFLATPFHTDLRQLGYSAA